MTSKSTKARKQEAAAKAREEPQTLGPISVNKSGNFQIKILAKPGSKNNEIIAITDEGVEVKISAPPIDGEANTELISFLSKLFNLRKSDLSLDRGNKSRTKTIIIGKDAKITLDKINEMLKENVGK